ncbi:hypothetical protein M422DRAFT_776219 [Sphaerobolus stellatus SS14]|nr:hypothetical protein M422DRAFT_776219 [Sphaerobolus stellatus SS14]
MSYPVQFPKDAPLLTVTHPTSSVWVIELHNGEDNRLIEHFIQNAIMPALDLVENAWDTARDAAKATKDKEGGKGALVIIGKRNQDKFFSNGFDYPAAVANPNFIPNTYNTLMARLVGFPLPTVAAINGHVFAAGFITALTCDYRVIVSDKKRRVWGSMNEVHFGAPLPHSFSALLNFKVKDPKVLRRIVLEGHRFTPSELLDAGLVDDVVDGGSETVLARACEIAEQWSENARMGAWGLIRERTHRVVLEGAGVDGGAPSKSRL